MAYKIRKFRGKGMGGYGKSGYLQPKDPMAAYRQPPAPDSEYSRKLRNKVLRDEISGPSGFLHESHSYKNKQPAYTEHGLSRDEINELVQESLKEALESHVEATGVKPVPTEVALVAHDAARIAANRLNKDESAEEVSAETITPAELSYLNYMRQEQVREISAEQDQASSLEEVEQLSAEIRAVNQDFFDKMDKVENVTKTEPVETTPLETSSPYEMQRRRSDLDLEAGW